MKKKTVKENTVKLQFYHVDVLTSSTTQAIKTSVLCGCACVCVCVRAWVCVHLQQSVVLQKTVPRYKNVCGACFSLLGTLSIIIMYVYCVLQLSMSAA